VRVLEPTPTRLDLNFDLFGTPVRVSAWFWVVPGLIGAASALFLGAEYLFLAPACFFVSVLVHEFGHVFAGRSYGQESYVVLHGLGGVAVGAADVGDCWPRIHVAAAGPAVQLILGGLVWAVSQPALHLLLGTAPYRDAVQYTLIWLQVVSIGTALLNLIPVWPLDGWHIANELVQQFLGLCRPPWERHANWWTQGGLGSDYRQPWHAGMGSRASNRLPLTILLVAVSMAVAWIGMGRHLSTPTATQVMQHYRDHPEHARGLWRFVWPARFRGVLRKPPWEKTLYQYEDGDLALVYFVTDNPGEWIFCDVCYDEKVRSLQEGREYIVSGTVYHVEAEGKLFLMDCALQEAD
jgi:Zn-dependent protease